MNTVLPPVFAAKARRRLAVMEKARASPQALSKTAPTVGVRKASSPMTSSVWISDARTKTTSDGDNPI
ncbi:hypothetical protein [uncultured Brevundimonas sp.]|uniref:hypothetical protein n=1 Tax=uncultured Brevundimonas sp. TaxID=213418 RepID=UPI0025F85068|nr:hypothetical protein [uncultured Brevundimonas sp.]